MNTLAKKAGRKVIKIKDFQKVALPKNQTSKVKGGTGNFIIVEDVIDG